MTGMEVERSGRGICTLLFLMNNKENQWPASDSQTLELAKSVVN